ncbi:MAG TPA: FAD-binding protein, partial [Thermodesulfobacteriota bacterium]|nr:FAD-binding protein [Thermodesulfobacteriota bacterium]
NYDVIIVGAGPAGIFSALELSEKKGLRILLLEKGKDLPERERKDLFFGWGGAGTFSDGKLNLSADVGGFLSDYLDRETLAGLISHVDGLYLKFGAPEELKGIDEGKVKEIEDAAKKAGLSLVPFNLRHLGTDRCVGLLQNIRTHLDGKIDVRFGKEAKDIIVEGASVKGVRTSDGEEFFSRFVILSPGRAGSQWLEVLAKKTGLTIAGNPVDIGVRVEVPASVLSPITEVVHEAKFTYDSKRFRDRVRTFCMNPYGVVVNERHEGFSTVNGHSYSNKKSENTNFAILVSTLFTEPFHEPIAYGRYIATLANLLGEGIIVQRLGDLLSGRRSTAERIKNNPVRPTLAEATPGDLSFVIPYRYISDIIEMLGVLDRVSPGINADSTLLYGVEVKFYSMRLKLKPTMETEVENLFSAGDGAGVTRGIVQASVSGVIAAREIMRRGHG